MGIKDKLEFEKESAEWRALFNRSRVLVLKSETMGEDEKQEHLKTIDEKELGMKQKLSQMYGIDF